MAAIPKKNSKPEAKRKKIIIIAAIIAIVCLSASGGLYFMLKGSGQEQRDEFGGPGRPRFHDANLPDARKQSYDDIMAYRNSDKFKKLSQREQMMYTMMSGRQVMEHNVETYFNLPKEQKTAYLDKVIDEMQQMRPNFEQMRRDNPRRRDANDVNDPNRAARRAAREAQMNNPSRARSMRERGNPEQRAKQMQFMQAMQKRMQQRGISMPRFGGGPGGGPGGPGSGR
jgi:hypothetical protein